MAKEEKGFLGRDLQAENMQEYIYMLFKKDIFEEAPKKSEQNVYWNHTAKNPHSDLYSHFNVNVSMTILIGFTVIEALLELGN